ncbi:head decoration protein [Brevibacillus centrosporus]|uniref:head decoration protein n=1 Tax=Brevibacillus centrosporus TaxID=54910 RepID=UPI000F0A4898|nr:head decoration protein [Brevibacillus centrosporus]MEC2131817.1 head decoration protein [Brevibacillus centrosporus]RNB72118.1 head decoration protein [Brevibacillus centrosporus]
MPTYESVKFDDLFAGGVKPPTAIAVVVKAGSGVITRGMVLGKTTQLGESDLYAGTPIMVPVDSTKTDGSEEPYAILADVEVDATSKDVRAVAYTDGEFNRAALKFGGADTIATHETALRKIGIITKRVVK